MALHTVSNAAELSARIRSASDGDTIVLKAGHYGQLNIANSSKALTITSESVSSPATLAGIQVQKSSNLTFDNLDFQGTVSGGWGTGSGFKAWESRNITIENSDFQDYFKGLEIARSQGVTVAGNEFERQSEDAMAFSGINGLQVIGNHVKGMKAPNQAHHDMIQVHTASGASSNVVIRDNVLDSNDLQTYGITFFGAARHQNVTIDNNKVIGGHHHGITVENASGLRVTNNVVLKDIANTSTRDVNLPKINVSPAASDVQAIGNIAYQITGAIGSANTLVSTKVTFNADASVTVPTPEPPGSGDVFRFDGDDVRGWTRTTVRELDFSEGDALEFADYRPDTFAGDAGFGSTAMVDSASDLRSLIASSSAVTGHDWGSTLALRVSQDHGTHAINIIGVDAGDFL